MNICSLTESAKLQIDKLCEDNNCYAISLNLKGGGCAGFEYDWNIIVDAKTIDSNDEIIETGGNGRLVIGSYSVMYLVGTELDYVKALTGSNFEIRNPNTKSSCGCGVSVNFDFDTFDHHY